MPSDRASEEDSGRAESDLIETHDHHEYGGLYLWVI